MTDELAESEAFMAEVAGMYTGGQLHAYTSEYERMKMELARMRSEADQYGAAMPGHWTGIIRAAVTERDAGNARELPMRAVVEAARGVLGVRPFGSWEPQWDTLRDALDALDGEA